MMDQPLDQFIELVYKFQARQQQCERCVSQEFLAVLLSCLRCVDDCVGGS